MTLSNMEPEDGAKGELDQASSVSWRLNELIKAGRKARAFAEAEWAAQDEPDNDQSFTLWTPEVVADVSLVDAELTVEESVDDQPTVEVEVEPEPETETVEEQPAEPAPAIDQQELEQARQDSFDQGYQQAMDEALQKWGDARNDFVTFTDALRKAQSDTNAFFQPLKKLALHLAEQLVRGELTLSTAAIERLVDAAIKDIEQQGEGPIVVNLNAADHQQFSQHLSSDLAHLSLRIDPELSRGSVRITMDDSAIEDLMESRLSALSNQLLGLPGAKSVAPLTRVQTPIEAESAEIAGSEIESAEIEGAEIEGYEIESSELDLEPENRAINSPAADSQQDTTTGHDSDNSESRDA
jgi:flagellar biosynthesis/type III secretory pathway protein FliH